MPYLVFGAMWLLAPLSCIAVVNATVFLYGTVSLGALSVRHVFGGVAPEASSAPCFWGVVAPEASSEC